MEGKEINTSSSSMIEDDQIVDNVQSPPPMPQAINMSSPLDEIYIAPNSPTNVEDLSSEDEDSEDEDEMMEDDEGMEGYVDDDLALDSKIKALEKRVENLMVENTLLHYESLYCRITNRLLEAQVARKRASNVGLTMQHEEQDVQLQAIREILEWLEKSLTYFPRTSKKPRNP